MITTEKGIDRLDLPHVIERAKEAAPCTCGRPDHDPIHNLNVLERAAHASQTIITEKGI